MNFIMLINVKMPIVGILIFIIIIDTTSRSLIERKKGVIFTGFEFLQNVEISCPIKLSMITV